MTTILLTGATGFVGRQVLAALRAHSAKICLVMRSGTGSDFDRHSLEKVITTPDLFSESPDWWADICTGIDTIIHLAWYAEPGQYLQSPENLDCLIGTLNLAKGASYARVRRFIGVGTCAEYDLSNGLLSVETPLKPTTPYAASKAATWFALSQWLPTQDVAFVWCRLFYLYGEGEDKRRLVPYLRAKLQAGEIAELTSGKQVRDFLDVKEAGRRIVEVALSDIQGPINICSGIPITVREMAEKIADEYGRRELLSFGARPDNLFDPISSCRHLIV